MEQIIGPLFATEPCNDTGRSPTLAEDTAAAYQTMENLWSTPGFQYNIQTMNIPAASPSPPSFVIYPNCPSSPERWHIADCCICYRKFIGPLPDRPLEGQYPVQLGHNYHFCTTECNVPNIDTFAHVDISRPHHYYHLSRAAFLASVPKRNDHLGPPLQPVWDEPVWSQTADTPSPENDVATPTSSEDMEVDWEEIVRTNPTGFYYPQRNDMIQDQSTPLADLSSLSLSSH